MKKIMTKENKKVQQIKTEQLKQIKVLFGKYIYTIE
jgi:hypothetical protein